MSNNAQQCYVEIADNGAGIAEHVVRIIFVPFLPQISKVQVWA